MHATASLRLPPPPVLLRKQESSRARSTVRVPWIRRWLARSEPTAYQRCLAVHIYYAAPRSALS